MTGERASHVPHRDDSLIVVDLYDGAYGLTLRLDVQRPEALAEIGGIFSRLAEHSNEEIHLASREGFLLTDSLADVVLIAGTSRQIEVAREKSQMFVKWRQRSSDWRYARGLVDGLIELGLRGHSGHQYLTEDRAEVLVELAYKE